MNLNNFIFDDAVKYDKHHSSSFNIRQMTKFEVFFINFYHSNSLDVKFAQRPNTIYYVTHKCYRIIIKYL